MRIIYFAGSVHPSARESIDQERILIGSEAVKLREEYIFNSLICDELPLDELIFVTTGYGVKSNLFKTVEINGAKFKTVVLGYWGRKYLRHITSYIFSFLWVLNNHKQNDILITYNFPPVYAIPICVLKVCSRIKLIIEFEDFFHKSQLKYYLYGPFEYIGKKFATAFIAASSGMKNHLNLMRPDSEIIINSGYQIKTTEPVAIKRPLGNLRLLYSGSLDVERGVSNLLSLFANEPSSDFKISFSGSGPLKNMIIAESKRNTNIRYLGTLNETEYANEVFYSDVCINSQLSTISVNFPSKISTYLAFGKIVLSTRSDSLINSPYAELITFYDDTNHEDFWVQLDYIRGNIDHFVAMSEKRVEKFKDILRSQESALGHLIDGVSRS